MKRLLFVMISVLALLVLAAPVAADEDRGNSPDREVTVQATNGQSTDAHARNEERKADAEDEEVNSEEDVNTEEEDEEAISEEEDSSKDENENGAQRLQFYTVTDASSDNVTTTEVEGTVSVVVPSGTVALVIQGNVRSGLESDTEYEVWVRALDGYTGPSEDEYEPLDYFMLGTFTTNEAGHGQFHLNLLADDLPAGTYEIQVAVNIKDGGTVAATSNDPFLSVTVGTEVEE